MFTNSEIVKKNKNTQQIDQANSEYKNWMQKTKW